MNTEIQKYNSRVVATILIIINILISLGTDIHLPALPLMSKALHASEFQTQLVLIVFMIGAIFGRLVWGPLSDIYGRRKILIITIGLHVISQFGAMLSHHIYWLIFWRIFQSLGAGVITVVSMAVIADMFKGDNQAKYLSLQEMAFPLSFIIAPFIGAYLVEYTNSWRAGFVFMFCVLVFCWLAVYLFVPETNYHPHKNQKVVSYFKSYAYVIKNKRFMIYSLIVGLTLSEYMIFVIVSPFIYMTKMKIAISEYALLVFYPTFISVVSTLLYKSIVMRLGRDRCINISIISFFLMIPIYLLISLYHHNITVSLILVVICLRSAIVPFFLSGLTSKAMSIYPDLKGLSSSVIASIKSLCISFTMIIGSYFIGSNVSSIFLTQGLIIVLIMLLFFITVVMKEVPKA